MDWQDIIGNWEAARERLRTRFPQLDGAYLTTPPSGPEEVKRHLADRHDLTPFEAQEELDDWLFSEHLLRQADRLAG